MQGSRWYVPVSVVVFCIPGLMWYQQTGNPGLYFSTAVPKGQLLYVLSKLMGLLALLSMAWHMITSLLSKLQVLPAHFFSLHHRLFGLLTLVLTLSHFLLFFAAVTLRQGAPAWGLLQPDFGDFYHTHLTLGLMGLIVLLMVAAAGLISALSQQRWANQWHRLYWLSISLIYLHALSIGSESQSIIGLWFYSTLGMTVLVLGGWYGFQQPKKTKVMS